ncbi:spore cortex biosynthesis protein YabQ [Evansella cellulosilytica]|uniref:Spore cortex biosynthesis protein YabQ n=1 Tax=Evansella cellulosilytica (strain ATCC 21833 / DSM 2522 / FERM P-1141 / JCM 9156 / N-4) TaxID=649639 RepID=E6TSD7_EVAC2|nr:spore cortex biosynthesis protein YabQ [Evansella cellulosilytica]ADU28352.1 spore cortex biosynthesis protein YabQ [Evansella cellulosilytica DSM 2522]
MTLEVQFLSMVASAATGLWFGASFDTYKRFVGSSKSFRWTLLINDLLFWLLQSLIFFYVLLQVNQGEVRIYMFFALLLGYSMYRALLENMYRQLLEKLIRFFQKLFRTIIRCINAFIINPLKWLLQVIISLSIIILTACWKIISFILKLLLSPFRWLIDKYVKAFGNPFEKVIEAFKRIKHKLLKAWSNLFDKRDE